MTVINGMCYYSREFNISLDCVFMAVNYMDRVLMTEGTNVCVRHLWVVGTLSLLLAAKYEDGTCHGMDLMEVSRILDSKGVHLQMDTLRQLEWRIFQTLHHRIAWPSPLTFLRRYSRSDSKSREAQMMATYLIEIMLYEAWFQLISPSQQAGAALYASRLMLFRLDWVCVSSQNLHDTMSLIENS